MNVFDNFKIRFLMKFAVIVCLAPRYCQSDCGPVTNLSSVLINLKNVLIYWDKPRTSSSCEKSKYVVSYRLEESNICTTMFTRVPFFTISKSHLCDAYSITVTPENASIGSAKLFLKRTGSVIRDLSASEIKSWSVELTWKYYLCTPNGKSLNFSITLENTTPGNYTNKTIFNIFDVSKNITTLNYNFTGLLPFNDYYCTVKEMTIIQYPYIQNLYQISHRSKSIPLKTDSTIPDLPSKEYTAKHLRVTLIENNPQQVKLTISNELFRNYNGMILYYSIILFGNYNSSIDVPEQKIKKHNEIWPPIVDKIWVNTKSSQTVAAYQTSPDKWMPFKNGEKEATFFVGYEKSCFYDINYCNGPLKPDTTYYLKVRALTSKEYQETWPVSFHTLKESKYIELRYWVRCSILFVILLLTGVGIMHGVMNTKVSWEKLNSFRTPWKLDHQLQAKTTQEIAIEYNALNSCLRPNLSTYTSCNIAMMSQNRLKNRYVDIIPYDYNRVVLTPNTDNYINASFIKYDKNTQKYIACQGPMENTCTDMWQMILDQDVASIVMLCEATEMNKGKCTKYFPNDEEISVQFGDIRIKVEKIMMHNNSKCSFTTRNLTVQKGDLKKSIFHFQYHGWPDFGTPEDPSTVVNFCGIVRRKSTEGLIVVHCSAGVGRTGTYIACDILMQLIQKDIKPLSVFKIVQKLRSQRKNMVQTQDQYEFLYAFLANSLNQQDAEELS